VLNALGAGFLEKVYENALALEVRAAGLAVVRRQPVRVRYRETVVGDFVVDLMVENRFWSN